MMNDLEWAEKCFLEADEDKVTEVMEEVASVLEVYMEGVLCEDPKSDGFVNRMASLSQAMFCFQQLFHAWLIVKATKRGVPAVALAPFARKAYDLATVRLDNKLFDGRKVLANGGDSEETTDAADQLARILSELQGAGSGDKKGWN